MHRRDAKHKCFVVDSGPFREGLRVVLRWRAVGGQMDRILSRNRRFRNLRAHTSVLISCTDQGLEQGPNSRMLISLAVDSGRESSLTHLQVAARDHFAVERNVLAGAESLPISAHRRKIPAFQFGGEPARAEKSFCAVLHFQQRAPAHPR